MRADQLVTASTMRLPALTVSEVTRIPAGMFDARTRANVAAISCFVESERLIPAKVADSIFAVAAPFVTSGEATTTTGPERMNARPVAVRVSLPGSSLIRGSLTVMPLTVSGV